jgi:hypothetical protein
VDPYDVFDSESPLELNPEVVTLTPGTSCIIVMYVVCSGHVFGIYVVCSGQA